MSGWWVLLLGASLWLGVAALLGLFIGATARLRDTDGRHAQRPQDEEEDWDREQWQ